MEQYFKWHSPILGRESEMIVFGDRGYPLIIFPTSMGRYYQCKDFKLMDSINSYIDNGYVKAYCVDSIDEDSWYNKKIHPSERVHNHTIYDRFIHDEIIPRALYETGHSRVAVAGCSFGGYHSANFAFRYPEKIGYLFSMSGSFNIKPQMDTYYDNQVYFNNPPDYLPALENPALYDIGIVLGVGEHDICLQANKQMSQILQKKGVSHWLDVRKGAVHDWPVWREMFPHYISQMKFDG
jgi:esterase/lipase superfamily enzyme